MKSLLLNNWEAKLVSLALAAIVWFAIRKNVEISTTDRPSETSAAARTR